jgi:hypothetical protein
MFTKEAQFFKPEVIEQMLKNPGNVKNDPPLWYPKSPPSQEAKDTVCKAVLIDAPTQSGKTRKCFEVMQEKIKDMSGRTLVLFVTQANSIAGANQVMQRASTNPAFKDFNIHLAEDCVDTDGNHMVIGYWNSRNTSKMLDFVQEKQWDNIIIVVDEADQGNISGIYERLRFIHDVERMSKNSNITVIFVTATIGNLSKGILRIANAKENSKKFSAGVVRDIVEKCVVEHQFAEPTDNYVGPSWFTKNDDVWKKLKFASRAKDMSKDEHDKLKEGAVLEQIKRLSFDAKELSLVVTSTRTADHSRMAEKLTRYGYDVIVEMNNAAGREFKVRYMNYYGEIATWNIPVNVMNAKADAGELKSVREHGKNVETGINGKDDLSMPHILQAALFMNTTSDKRIMEHVTDEEYIKLKVINDHMGRPKDFPAEPRVALVTGYMAGRGITFQNPAIDFTCTSFVFTDTKDAIARGASNAQRFGRACGMLGDVFSRPGRQPVLVATKGIVDAAVANEAVVMEKAQQIPNGTMLCLKDLITEEEWKRIMKSASDDTKSPGKKEEDEGKIDGVDIAKLKKWMNSKTLIGKMVRFLYDANKQVSFDEFKTGIEYTKSDDEFESNIRNAYCVNSQYGFVFETTKNNQHIVLNPKIKAHIDTM